MRKDVIERARPRKTMTNGCPGHSRLDPRCNPNQPRLHSMSMTIGEEIITNVARLEARSRGRLDVREDSYEAWKGAVKLPALGVTREKWRRGEICSCPETVVLCVWPSGIFMRRLHVTLKSRPVTRNCRRLSPVACQWRSTTQNSTRNSAFPQFFRSASTINMGVSLIPSFVFQGNGGEVLFVGRYQLSTHFAARTMPLSLVDLLNPSDPEGQRIQAEMQAGLVDIQPQLQRLAAFPAHGVRATRDIQQHLLSAIEYLEAHRLLTMDHPPRSPPPQRPL
ncbi:hypothetical protein B0H13DRAFT_1890979 [Mycena leptocephala]|nr:hypothetical protein B0H13DRAFT_1890979 [Mycena leptocephala]